MWSDISSLYIVNRVQHSSNFFYKCVSNIPMISQIMIPTRSEDIADVDLQRVCINSDEVFTETLFLELFS